MSDKGTLDFKLSIAAGAFRDTVVVGVTGTEALSRPYLFDIDVLLQASALDFDGILGLPVTLSAENPKGDVLRQISGLVTEAGQIRRAADGRYRYRLRLEPRLAMLGRRRRNQLFAAGGPESLEAVITRQMLGGHGSEDRPELLSQSDFEFRLAGQYPKLEHVVQYDESDLDFLHRLTERHGLFYFFEQDEESGREKVIFCDTNAGFSGRLGDLGAASKPETIPYHPGDGLDTDLLPQITALSYRRSWPIRSLSLRDYNYRKPNLTLMASATVDGNGQGLEERYGDHFPTPEEGTRLASARSEMLIAQSRNFDGLSTVAAFQPGHLFTLTGHENPNFEGRHLITRVEHQAEHPVFGESGLGGEAVRAGYRNRFTAIPATLAYRQPQTTPVPKLHGVMHGFVDGSIDDGGADIDEEGRYKIRIPFDPVGRKATEASRYIRMAQPYGGAGHGMHMPLTPDTEVLWTCIDGDLDRPIICGVVPNPNQPSVVTARNRSSNIIRTVSGAELEISDSGTLKKSGPAASATENVGSATPPTLGATTPASTPPASRLWSDARIPPKAHDYSGSHEETRHGHGHGPWDITGNFFKVDVASPNHDKKQEADLAANMMRSYLRVGGPNPGDEEYLHSNYKLGKLWTVRKEMHESGWLEHTNGGKFTYIGGNVETLIEGEVIHRVAKGGETLKYSHVRKGPSGQPHEVEMASISKSEYIGGDVQEYIGGYAFEAKLGLFTDITVGGKLDIFGGFEVEVKGGFGVKFMAMPELEIEAGGSYSVAKEKELIAGEKIVLEVNPASYAKAMGNDKLYMAALAMIAPLIGGGVGAGIADESRDEHETEGDRVDRWFGDLGISASTGAIAAAGVAAFAAFKAANAHPPVLPKIVLKDDKISLSCGPTSKIEITANAIVVEAAAITLDGNVTVTGNLTVDRDATVEGTIDGHGYINAENDLRSHNGNIVANYGQIFGRNIRG